jgi:hypothetical protein
MDHPKPKPPRNEPPEPVEAERLSREEAEEFLRRAREDAARRVKAKPLVAPVLGEEPAPPAIIQRTRVVSFVTGFGVALGVGLMSAFVGWATTHDKPRRRRRRRRRRGRRRERRLA